MKPSLACLKMQMMTVAGLLKMTRMMNQTRMIHIISTIDNRRKLWRVVFIIVEISEIIVKFNF